MHRVLGFLAIFIAFVPAMPTSSEPLATSMGKIIQLFGSYLNQDDLSASNMNELLPFAEAKDPYAFHDLIIKREYSTIVSDYEVIVSVRSRPDGSWNDTTMTFLKIKLIDDLKLQHELFDTLKQAFGEPSKVVDCGFLANPASKGTAISAVEAEWKRGPRRLWFSSSNLLMSFGKFMPIAAALQVSDTSLRQDLQDLVYLKLINNPTSDSGSGNLPTVVVDLNNKRLLTPGWVLIGYITELTSSRLSAKWGNNNSTITIDRLSGTFDLDLVESSLPNGKQRVSGTVEKIEAEKERVF